MSSINSIREVLNISCEEDLAAAFRRFDEQLDDVSSPLQNLLECDIMSLDIRTLTLHMTAVESWRSRLVKWFSFASAGLRYAKSDVFLREKKKGVTELDREATKARIMAGWEALTIALEGLISSVDSRVNLCKKLVGVEGGVEGVRSNTRTWAA